MTQVKKSNTSLAFTERGSGPIVVLLHGLFGSGDNLNQLAQALAQDHRVISIDLPGHGQSSRLTNYGHESMANAIKALFQELNLSSLTLLGHSLGGKISMQLASQAETDDTLQIEKLIIVDIAPRDYPPHHDDVFAAINSVPLNANTHRRAADALMAEHIAEAGVRAFLLKSLRQNSHGQWQWRFDATELERQYSALALSPALPHRVQCPTLFIKGELSDYIEAQDEAAIRAAFAVPEFKILQGAGHWLHAEKPAAFQALVQRFLARS